MILQGVKKRVLKEVVGYYINTTGETYDTFVQDLLAYQCGQLDTTEYKKWLVPLCLDVLQQKGISLSDCVENKDTLQTIVASDKSRNEGEFYTPEPWCIEGRKYLQDLLGDQWGKVAVWDCSCGTGNLMRTAGYPSDKLFLSTLLEEDVQIVKQQFPEATVWQGNFVMDIDYDQNNMNFSNKLPENLRKILENDEPICFYINPPYRVGVGTETDVGSYMYSKGMGKCGSDILYQFIYRICMLKKTYNLHNVYIGLFGGLTLFHSKMLTPMLQELRDEFEFKGGMCFTAGDFSNTSETIQWVITYTLWQSKDISVTDDTPIKLTCKVLDNGVVKDVGERTFEPVKKPLQDWVEPKDVENYIYIPTFTAFTPLDELGKFAVNAMGQLMSDNYAIRGTRRNSVFCSASHDFVDITTENLDRAVVSFVARVLYKLYVNPFDNCQFYSEPDTTVEHWDIWLANAYGLFVCDWANYAQSYRNISVKGEMWNLSNAFFPLTKEYVASIAVDPRIKEDTQIVGNVDNTFFLSKLQGYKPMWLPEIVELYNFCEKCLIETLTTNARAECGYENYTDAWDASFMQIRRAKGLWSDEKENTYTTLLGKAKKLMGPGVYKYGFLKHYATDYSDLQTVTVTEAQLDTMEREEQAEV